jgi:hypothetical protein
VVGEGQSFNQRVAIARPPEVVMRDFVTAVSGVSGYSLTTTGPGTIMVSRKYWPWWVIIGTAIGVWFFLIGLLLLLIRETESLTILLRPIPGGTDVQINGAATSEMATRLTMVMTSNQPMSSPAYAPPQQAYGYPVGVPGQGVFDVQHPPAIASEPSVVSRLEELKRLHEQGLISDTEYADQRQRLISQL